MVRSVVCTLLVLFAALCMLSCSASAPGGGTGVVPDGRYDSEFPREPVSDRLEQITESVLRLNSVAYYKTYAFGEQERVRKADLSPAMLDAHENTSMFSSSSSSGTATTIWASGRRILLLTCAHIVAYPETAYTFQYGADRRVTEFLATVSVQKRVSLFIASLPEGGVVDLLAFDKGADIAIVGRTFETAPSLPAPALRYPLGRASELEWGTFVYLFGYPSGNRVVTKGIVSSPRKDKRDSFLVDAVFGRGFSGGLCLALRDGVPNFEVVGMIKMVPARMSYAVTPGKDRPVDDLDIEMPYTGQLYLERRTEIDYGVTQAVSAEAIRAFLLEQREALAGQGYQLGSFVGADS